MLNLSLDILFSPTEANMEKARVGGQNHWLDGFMVLAGTIFFAVILESTASLLKFTFIKKGLLVDPTILPNIDTTTIFLDVAKQAVKSSFTRLFLTLLSVIITTGLASLFGGKGHIKELFFVQVVYNFPISILIAGSGIVVVVMAALAIKLHQTSILASLVIPAICFLPLSLYLLYLDFLAVKVVYKLTNSRQLWLYL